MPFDIAVQALAQEGVTLPEISAYLMLLPEVGKSETTLLPPLLAIGNIIVRGAKKKGLDLCVYGPQATFQGTGFTEIFYIVFLLGLVLD